MGRRPRIHFNGAIYHVWSRGVDRRIIFVEDGDRKAFLDALQRVCFDASAELLAYCLMGNHFHLTIKVADVTLAEIMRRVLSSYARGFNQRHERSGHLFEARYDAKQCLTEAYLSRVIPYILMNPVRAGLVAKPEDWPWSSLNGKPLQIGTDIDFEDFDPWEKEELPAIDLHRVEASPRADIESIVTAISAETGISRKELQSDVRRRPVVIAKRKVTQAAIKAGHALIAVAAWMNCDLGTVSRYARAKTLQSASPDTNIIVSNR